MTPDPSTRRGFLARLLAGAVATPALTRIIADSTKPRAAYVPEGQWTFYTGSFQYGSPRSVYLYHPFPMELDPAVVQDSKDKIQITKIEILPS